MVDSNHVLIVLPTECTLLIGFSIGQCDAQLTAINILWLDGMSSIIIRQTREYGEMSDTTASLWRDRPKVIQSVLTEISFASIATAIYCMFTCWAGLSLANTRTRFLVCAQSLAFRSVVSAEAIPESHASLSDFTRSGLLSPCLLSRHIANCRVRIQSTWIAV
jgi:hypothetical protein